jgi:PAS domain S-box-containing protein
MEKKTKTKQNRGLKWAMRRHELVFAIIELLNLPARDREHVVRDIAVKIRVATGLDAVGVRLREGEAYPYLVTSGLPDHFVEAENCLCRGASPETWLRDPVGNPVLKCNCGQVLQGRTDPSLSFYSQGGTFWTNSLSQLHDTSTEKGHLLEPGSLCRAEGYESVALIPIRCAGAIVGLLQLNDRREGCFSPQTIRFLEGIATSLGVVLERMASRASLARANEELEKRFQERTAELVRINDRLRMQIAECERIEEALQKSEARYRTLVETAREIIWTLDKNGKYTYVSPSVTRVLGFSPEEMMSLDPLDTVRPASRDLLMHFFSEEFTSDGSRSEHRSTSRTLVVEYCCKDGSFVWMEITATVLPGPAGTIDGILGVSREISERKQIEEMKTEFMTTAAHELQTPLTSIVGYSELLLIRDDFSEAEKRDCLRRINAQAGNLAALVSRLLGVWSETGRTFSADSTTWYLRESVEEIVASFRRQTSIHRFEIVFPQQPVSLTIAKGPFTEILVNVLNNAMQYSPDGGSIRLTCELSEDRCQFSVEDEGIGMTPEQVPRIFDRFYRADTSNTALSGLGLGMSLVKSLIESAGGRVWVESAYGKGTAVRFSLPCGFADASEGGRQSEENSHRR